MRIATIAVLCSVMSCLLIGQERIGNKPVRSTILNGNQLEYVDKTVTLKLKPGTDATKIEEYFSTYGATILTSPPQSDPNGILLLDQCKEGNWDGQEEVYCRADCGYFT
jgi:hypothetical protein